MASGDNPMIRRAEFVTKDGPDFAEEKESVVEEQSMFVSRDGPQFLNTETVTNKEANDNEDERNNERESDFEAKDGPEFVTDPVANVEDDNVEDDDTDPPTTFIPTRTIEPQEEPEQEEEPEPEEEPVQEEEVLPETQSPFDEVSDTYEPTTIPPTGTDEDVDEDAYEDHLAHWEGTGTAAPQEQLAQEEENESEVKPAPVPAEEASADTQTAENQNETQPSDVVTGDYELQTVSPSPSPITKSGPMKHLPGAMEYEHLFIGGFVGMAVAGLIACYCRRRRRRKQRELQSLKPWTNEINFHDECDSTDEEFDSLEGGMQYPQTLSPTMNSIRGASFDYGDWLGGIGFNRSNDENSHAGEKDDFGYADKGDESSSSSEYEDEDDEESSIQDLLDGESDSNRSSSFSFDSPMHSPIVNFTPPTPPTVSELFQNTLSGHWKTSPPPLSPVSTESKYEDLHREQEELNKELFLINDQILEQQRDLDAATKELSQKRTRKKIFESHQQHRKITEMIMLLETKKDEVNAKLKSVKGRIKTHRLERRRKLFRSK